jgi:thiaminase/transcriptional activator TenA
MNLNLNLNLNLAQTLWRENAALVQTILAHPFVDGLRTGELPRPCFQRYIAQDAYFLEAFARAYALALARCPDQAGMREFFALLSGGLDELGLHASYAARWDIDLATVTPSAATLAYTDFLLATAGLRDVGEICAAMTPCMRLYAFLGQQLQPVLRGREQHPYAEWIQTYAAPEFEAQAERLERLLDRSARDTEAVHSAYSRAMTLELGFFAAQFAPSEDK